MNEQIEPTKAKFESVTQIASGLASGLAAVQGAAALFGLENENLEKTLVKVQAAMALAQGIGGFGGLYEGISKAKVAFQGMITSIKAVTAAMSATGWLAVIVAVTAAIAGLVGWIKKTREESQGMAGDIKKLNEAQVEEIGKIGEEVVALKLYEKVATDVNEAYKTRQSAAEEALRLLGEEVNAVNTAKMMNGEYAEAIDNVTLSLINKAKAEAAYGMIVEKYNEAFAEQERLRQEATDYTNKANAKANAKPSVWDWMSASLLNAAYAEGAGGIEGGQTGDSRKQDWVTEYQNKAATATNKANNIITDLDDWVDDFLEASGLSAADLLGSKKKPQTKPNGDNKPKTFEELLAEVQQKLYEDAVNMVIEDIELDLDDSSKKSVGYEYKDGDAQKRYGFWNGIIDSETSQAVRRNALDGGTQEEQDALVLKGEERKLAKMKEFWEMAKQEGDVTGELEFRQMIADQELTIEEKKNEAILKSEEKAKEKRLKIMNEISTALSAAGSLTEGILQITQAAAEKDEQITEKEAKRIKGMQYAVATINMLQGITSALAGCFTTKTGPWDMVLAGVQAASIAAAGTANLIKIKNTDITGSVSSGAMGAVTPNSNVFGTDIPFSYTRNVTGQSEIDTLNEPIKVYVTESDITDAVNKSKVRVEEASF